MKYVCVNLFSLLLSFPFLSSPIFLLSSHPLSLFIYLCYPCTIHSFVIWSILVVTMNITASSMLPSPAMCHLFWYYHCLQLFKQFFFFFYPFRLIMCTKGSVVAENSFIRFDASFSLSMWTNDCLHMCFSMCILDKWAELQHSFRTSFGLTVNTSASRRVSKVALILV